MKKLLISILIITLTTPSIFAYVVSDGNLQQLRVGDYNYKLCKSEMLEDVNSLKSQNFDVVVINKCQKVFANNPQAYTFEGLLNI